MERHTLYGVLLVVDNLAEFACVGGRMDRGFFRGRWRVYERPQLIIWMEEWRRDARRGRWLQQPGEWHDEGTDLCADMCVDVVYRSAMEGKLEARSAWCDG